MKTKIEIINETEEYYTQDPSRRAVDYEGCHYYRDKKMCAFGRVMVNPKEFSSTFKSCTMLIEEEGLEILKAEYRIDDTGFWRDIQTFHDATYHWDKDGLTKVGNKFLNYLKTTYAI